MKNLPYYNNNSNNNNNNNKPIMRERGLFLLLLFFYKNLIKFVLNKPTTQKDSLTYSHQLK
jgi:hypothetical protein